MVDHPDKATTKGGEVTDLVPDAAYDSADRDGGSPSATEVVRPTADRIVLTFVR